MQQSSDNKRVLSRTDLPPSAAAISGAATAEPPLVFLTKAAVLAKIPVTAPTLWQWVRAGKFPAPRKISPNKVCWIEADVDAWMKARPLQRYKPI